MTTRARVAGAWVRTRIAMRRLHPEQVAVFALAAYLLRELGRALVGYVPGGGPIAAAAQLVGLAVYLGALAGGLLALWC